MLDESDVTVAFEAKQLQANFHEASPRGGGCGGV